MFLKRITKIPLFAVILILSSTLIFLASCKVNVPDELEENVISDVKEEVSIEEEEDVEPNDSKPPEDFIDLKGTKEVTINMKNILFDMPKIIIDTGTTVIWVNQDGVEHTVNSDPHPGHNNHPGLNSDYLSGGDTFSFTFDEPGLYTYHCTPHYPVMKGSILVN